MCRFNLKLFTVLTVSLLIILTIGIVVKKPQMHKQLQVNVIEYLLKINSDGSVTTTKSVTTNVVKEK